MNDRYWQWNNQALPVTFKAHIYTRYTPFKFFVAYVHVDWSVYTSDTKQSLIPDDSSYFTADPLQSLEKGDGSQVFIALHVPFKASDR